MRAWNEKMAGKFMFRTKKNNVLSETGANYYISKYSKYMYINIYTRARTYAATLGTRVHAY